MCTKNVKSHKSSHVMTSKVKLSIRTLGAGKFVNPLSPSGDQCRISPRNINA